MNVAGKPLSSWLSKLKRISFTCEVFAETNSAYLGGGFFSQGAHSYSKSKLDLRVKVGRYCSIGSNVTTIPANHPMDRLSTCGTDYAAFEFHPQGAAKVRPTMKPMSLIIGNDVWIGDSAMIKGDIRIGHGAVIGARAIVTKDVPPYAIVAGSPATVKRYRFDERTRERLLKAAWWNCDPEFLSEADTVNVQSFLDTFEAMHAEGKLKPYEPKLIKVHEIFAPGEVIVKGVAKPPVKPVLKAPPKPPAPKPAPAEEPAAAPAPEPVLAPTLATVPAPVVEPALASAPEHVSTQQPAPLPTSGRAVAPEPSEPAVPAELEEV